MTEIYFTDGSRETQIKSLEERKLELMTRNEEKIELEYDNRLNRASYSYEYLKKDFLNLTRSNSNSSSSKKKLIYSLFQQLLFFLHFTFLIHKLHTN